MQIEIISEFPKLVIQKLTLEPGEATHWHTDSCHRFTVVVSGSRLGIEFDDSKEVVNVLLEPGTAEWDAPEARVHRATNLGLETYCEVVSFYRDAGKVVPQPRPSTVGDK